MLESWKRTEFAMAKIVPINMNIVKALQQTNLDSNAFHNFTTTPINLFPSSFTPNPDFGEITFTKRKG